MEKTFYDRVGSEVGGNKETMHAIFPKATARAAIAAHVVIREAYQNGETLSPGAIKQLKVAIDRAAVDAMSHELHNQHAFCVYSVGSEGAKEVLHDGEEAPSLRGAFGHQHAQRLDKVSDAVEGTTAAANNQPGAVSILAVGEEYGLLPSQENSFYMEKLFGPQELRGHISLEYTPTENLKRACMYLHCNPGQLTVVILNRPRNQAYIDAALAMGVHLQLIEAGDLMPSLLASAPMNTHKRGPCLVMGIGGYEEGVIAAAGTKAMKGTVEGRLWSDKTGQTVGNVLKIQDLVPGARENILVSASSITGEPWFGLSPAREVVPRLFAVQTLVITAEGIKTMIRQYQR